MNRALYNKDGTVQRVDHAHRCCSCQEVYDCKWWSLADCRKKGVFAAVRVNKGGPYCDACRVREEKKRLASLRSEVRHNKKKEKRKS